MAVLVPNKQWTTYQDKQLDVLKDIESDLYKSLNISTKIERNLEDLPDVIYAATNLLVHSIDSIWNNRDLPDITGSMRHLETTIEQSLNDVEESIEENNEEESEEEKELNESILSLKDVIEELDLKEIPKYIGEQAQGFTELYNETIKMTGANKNEAQKFRRDVVNIVEDMNDGLGVLGSEIGDKLNSKDVLDTMLAISNQTNISNRETLKAITTPAILAQESMAIDIAAFSELAGRFYTKYNFTSKNLEGLVDHIRNSTEGKDVSEQTLLSAIDKLETRIALSTGGNTSAMLDMQKSLTSGISWLESNYIDSTPYLEDLHKFMSSDVRDRVGMASRYGNASQIQSLVNDGKLAKALELMVSTTANYDVLTASARGIDTEIWEEAKATMITEGFTPLQEYLNSIDDSQKARESLEDKFVSIQEQMKNELTGIASYVSKISEDLGIGIDDITLLISTVGNVKTLIGGSGSTIAGGKGLAGLLSAGGAGLGAAAGVGAAVVAVFGLVKGISDIQEKVHKQELEEFEKTMDAAKSLEYGQQLMWKEVLHVNEQGGIDKSYELAIVSASEFDQSLHEENARRYQEQQKNNIHSEYLDEGELAENFFVQALSLGQVGNDWYDWIPVVGRIIEDKERDEKIAAVSSRAEKEEEFRKWVSSLNADSLAVFKGYSDAGLLETERQRDYFMKYFSSIRSLHDKGYAKELSGVAPTMENSYSRSDLLGYDVGANYIPYDQLAYIHEGEAIVPEEYNPAANMNELERLRAESQKNSDSSKNEVVETLREIKEFMSLWKDESHRDKLISTVKTNNAQRMNMVHYMREGR